MNSLFKYKTPLSLAVALLLSSIANFSVNAATVEIKEDVKENGLNFSGHLDYIKQQESSNKQAIERVKNNYLQVLELIKLKQYQDANTKVASLLQQNPEQSLYYNLKALLQLVDKNQTGAEQSLLKAVKLNARNTQALTGLAKMALDNKQFDLAKEYADTVLAINPNDIKAYQILASVAMQQHGIDAVEALLLDARNKVKNNTPTEQAIIQSLRKVYINKKQPEKLLELATGLIERDKEDAFALSMLAEAQILNQDNMGAEKTLRQFVAQYPKDAKHLFLLLQLLDKQKNKETEMLGLLDRAILNLDNPSLVLSYKAAVLIKQKQFQQAFTIARELEQLNPNKGIGKILKGDIYLAEKNYPEALNNYQQAYDITPNIKILDGILTIFSIQNKPDAAINLLKKELAKNKDDTKIQFRLAVSYQNSGQKELASKHYEAVLTQQPENVIALNNLAWIYNELNNPKAEKLAKQAYELAPKSGAIADTYGLILLKNGNKQLGLTVLKQAAELDPTLAEIQLHLAEAYIANQNESQAKIILQNLLNQESAESEKAKALLAKLK